MAIDGYVDELSREKLHGWACDRLKPNKILDVHLLVDGKIVKTVSASQARTDLTTNGLPACAFDFGDILKGFDDFERIEVRCENEKVPLKNGLVDRRQSRELAYATAWIKPSTLADLNLEIHDNWPVEKLHERASIYHDIAFDAVASDYVVPSNAEVLEIGSGVGWPMQAIMEKFPHIRVSGLDISETMIARASSRLEELSNLDRYRNRYSFHHYDGSIFPFSDGSFDVVYSYAVLWHVPDPILIRALIEAKRVLKPGGLCIYQFIDFKHLKADFQDQIAIQYGGQEGHHRYYRSQEQLLRIASDVVGMQNVDLQSRETIYWLRGEKGHPAKFRRKQVSDALASLEAAVRF